MKISCYFKITINQFKQFQMLPFNIPNVQTGLQPLTMKYPRQNILHLTDALRTGANNHAINDDNTEVSESGSLTI